MGLFSRKDKRKPQSVDLNNEITRVSKMFYECQGKVENITVDKTFISEYDYNAIQKGITKVIGEVIEEKGYNSDKMDNVHAMIKAQKAAFAVIEKMYDVDWVY
jgi:hypothetical protein